MQRSHLLKRRKLPRHSLLTFCFLDAHAESYAFANAVLACVRVYVALCFSGTKISILEK
jgi:hypothetical protein